MSANLIIDISLAVVSLVLIIKFTVKGFLHSVLDALKVFIAGFIAYLIRIPVANIINDWFLEDRIVGWVESSLLEALDGGDTFVNFFDLYEEVPELFGKVLSQFGLGDVSSLGDRQGLDATAVKDLSIDIGSSISMMLSTVIAVIVLFIVAVIVLTIVIKLLDGLMKLSAVKFINRALGFVLGVACSALLIWGTDIALSYLIGVTNGFGGRLSAEMLDSSMLISLIRTFIK